VAQPDSPNPRRPRGAPTLALLALAGAALLLGFLALGVWQVERRAWKLDLIARVDARLHAPAQPLPPASQWPGLDVATNTYTPMRLQGRWLPGKTVLTQATTELGAGFWVLTPLQLADGGQVLVNRGFIPQALRRQWLDGDRIDTASTTTVVGLLRASEPGGGFLRRNDPAAQRWHSRDVAAIAQAQGLTRAAPFFIDAGLPSAAPRPAPEATPEAALAAAGPWPRPGLTVVRFHNSHLSYALTWFTLAALVIAAAVLVARYELRLRRTQRHHHAPSP
jgi:surfeit locus 1 family protein